MEPWGKPAFQNWSEREAAHKNRGGKRRNFEKEEMVDIKRQGKV